jgi:hypothetical protein
MEVKKLWESPRDRLDPWARKTFYQISGLHREAPGQVRMENQAKKSWDDIKDHVYPRAILSHYTEVGLQEGRLTLDGEWIFSQVLEQVDPSIIKGAVAYGLTIGDLPEDPDLFLKLMGDFWGTAYIDSARKAMWEDLQTWDGFQGLSFSEELGPGFFGMGTNSLMKLDRLLDLSQIDVMLLDKGAMMPAKSVVGLFLLTQGEPLEFPNRCLFCKGNEKGCAFCGENQE